MGTAPEVRGVGCRGGLARLPAVASLENASFVGGVACIDRAGWLESCCCLAPSVASPVFCPEVPVELFHRSANASILKRKGSRCCTNRNSTNVGWSALKSLRPIYVTSQSEPVKASRAGFGFLLKGEQGD